MSTASDHASAIERLEIRVAYQDQTIEELNSTVLAQWKAIEELRRDLVRLEGRLRETEQQLPDALPEPPPPHY